MENKTASIKNSLETIAILLLSYGAAAAVAMVSGYSVTEIGIVLPILAIFAGIVFFTARKAGKRADLKYALPFAGIFSLTMTIGSKIHVYDAEFETFGIMDIGIFLLLFVFFTAVTEDLFMIIEKYNVYRLETVDNEKNSDRRAESAKPQSEGKNGGNLIVLCRKVPLTLRLIFLFMICWLPYYLTFFPGNMGPDTFESVRMVIGEIPWTNHHPVFFTFLIKIVLDATGFLHSLTASMGIFTFLHMLVFAGILSRITIFLWKKELCIQGKIMMVLFFAFHPIITMYSMYITKDVLFGGVLALLVLKLYELAVSKGELLVQKKECVKLALLTLLSILLRNNGLYIAVVLAVVLLIVYRRKWKQLLCVFGIVLVAAGIYQGPVFKAMGIEKQSFAESASVPLQQIGYVIWQDGNISEDDRAFLEQLMPLDRVKEVYDPGYTDPYKFDEEFNDDFLNENVGEFLKVWWHLCRNNFGDYVKAYLMQTAGYWHYGETNTVATQGIADNSLQIVQIDSVKNLTGVSLEPIFEKMILAARKAPFLCILSSMAMEMFGVLFCCIQYMRRKKNEMIVALVPLMVLWVTVMIASPAFCLFRYLFPVFLLWPVILYEILSGKQGSAK